MSSVSKNRTLYLTSLIKQSETRDALTIMYDLFHDPKELGSFIPLRKALNMSQKQLIQLETKWNKGLRLKEVADKIRSH